MLRFEITVDSHAVVRRMQRSRASFIPFPPMVTNSWWSDSVTSRLRLTLTWSHTHHQRGPSRCSRTATPTPLTLSFLKNEENFTHTNLKYTI